MNQLSANPRSQLHALTPYGQGTPEIESLVSYFCRLAASHSVSTFTLSRTIAKHFQHEVIPSFDWHHRQISGIRESALTWSAALSALTSVQDLDGLTFLPWRDVISQNGLSIVTRGQFCPACFAEDVASGRSPYFRLAWESAEVSVCARHGQPLSQHCPGCGKDNIRHAAAFVVPGWCTHCGEFLGKKAEVPSQTVIEPGALWRARQVGDLLAAQASLSSAPNQEALTTTITQLIAEMDNGQSAAFARRIGIGKSTIHHWLKTGGTPTLEISLKIAAQCGLSLRHLLTGELSGWRPPANNDQLVLTLPNLTSEVRRSPRTLDWQHVEAQLHAFLEMPTPISVLEAARRLDVEARQLYLRANRVTRQLGERWKDYVRRRQQASVANASPYLEAACLEIWAEGKAVTRREIAARVPAEILSPVANLLNVLKDVHAYLRSSGEVAESTASDSD
ncbi:helix-turn-helix domain-containing protein [Noviherbaspirillum cavernae]|uniref:Helix-turn-helix domain-containing protein n=1 Tax=Noviherbaspirillum cavernae TaxID=2320862 RepID=A0A418X1G0_9BURK|nr:helix-turn-helix domain-containing protein [Noviherbaspirillum cavernae]RJG06289.1 helix-turn-helix domain-containing protein [Noviherbaspirillum cavernae]